MEIKLLQQQQENSIQVDQDSNKPENLFSCKSSLKASKFQKLLTLADQIFAMFST